MDYTPEYFALRTFQTVSSGRSQVNVFDRRLIGIKENYSQIFMENKTERVIRIAHRGVESTVTFLVGDRPIWRTCGQVAIDKIDYSRSLTEYFVSNTALQWLFQRSNRGTGGDKGKSHRKLLQPRRRPNRSSGFPALLRQNDKHRFVSLITR
jgi:hypothetical protein